MIQLQFLLLLIPSLSTMLICLLHFRYFSDWRQSIYLCLSESLKIQAESANFVNYLERDYNPTAKQYQRQVDRLTRLLAITLHPPTRLLLEAEKKYYQFQQTRLHQQMLKIYSELKIKRSVQLAKLLARLQTLIHLTKPSFTSTAPLIYPDLRKPSLAPPYRASPPGAIEVDGQIPTQSWQRIIGRTWQARFFDQEFKCSTQVIRQQNRWLAKIKTPSL